MTTPKFQRPTASKQSLTVNRISDETGIDRRTVRKRLTDAGLYPPENHPPGKVLEAVKPKDVPAEVGTKAALEVERWRKLKIANDKAEGKLIPVDVVKQLHATILARVDQVTEQKLCNEYPSAVAGLDVPQARIYGKRLGDQIREEFQKLSEEFK